jgi:hypothetical protein
MEAILVTLSGKKPAEMSEDDYSRLIDEIGFLPRIENFSEECAVN